MSSEYMFKKLWAKCHNSGMAEANDLAGFFASVTSQLRMEAKAGDKKTMERLEDLTDWIESVREETMASFKRQVKPIAASREMVSLAEEQLCLHMRGEVEEKYFLRDVDWRKLSMKGISKVVAPIVKEEAKRLAQSRSQHFKFGAGWQGHDGQSWSDGWGLRKGGGRGGGKGAGKGMFGNMAWSKDGTRIITCNKCGLLGHYANECPSSSVADSEKSSEGQRRTAGTAGAGASK